MTTAIIGTGGLGSVIAGFEPVKAGGLEGSSRLEVGGDFHDLVVGPAEARKLVAGG
jgi:8-hydroxy-5-deazaflavin:NADPH oxidoreductase